MKGPIALIFSVMLVLMLSQASFASNVGSPAYQPDGQSIRLDPSLEDPVNHDGSTAEGRSKVRGANKGCGPKDKDCEGDE